jgi:outer membrane protein assembly factor BamB
MQDTNDDSIQISDLDDRPAFAALTRRLSCAKLVRYRQPLWWVTVVAGLVFLFLLVRGPVLVARPPAPRIIHTSSPMNLFASAAPGVAGEILVVSQDGILSAWHQGTGKVIWQYKEASGVWGTPQVAQGIILANTHGGKVVALQATTGNVLWTHYETSFATSLLQVEDSIVFVRVQATRTLAGKVVALRTRNGSPRWSLETLQFHRFVDGHAGMVYISDGAGRITALRAKSGRLVWTEHTSSRSWMALEVNLGLVAVATQDGVAALRANDGATLWHTHLHPGALDVPLIGGGIISVPTADGEMSALDATSGALRWHAPAAPLIIAGELVYGLAQDERIVTLHAGTGTLLRSYQEIDSFQFSNGKIFALTATGDIIALQADTGAILWHWRPPSPVLALGSGTLVYVSTRNNGIIALRESSGEVAWNVGAQR